MLEGRMESQTSRSAIPAAPRSNVGRIHVSSSAMWGIGALLAACFAIPAGASDVVRPHAGHPSTMERNTTSGARAPANRPSLPYRNGHAYQSTCPGDPTVNLPVATPTGDQHDANAVPDGSGGAIVTWDDTRSGTGETYAEHVLSTGVLDPAWPSNGVLLSNGTGGAPPLITTDGAGGAVIAWTTSLGVSSLYVARVLASGVADPAWPAGGTPLGAGEFPKLIMDGSGGAFVVWDTGGTGGAVLAQHVLGTGVADPAWPAGGLFVAGMAGSQRNHAEICTDGLGGALVAWSDARNHQGFDIYAHHVLATGTVDPAWPVNGLPVCVQPGHQRFNSVSGVISYPFNSCADHQGNPLIPDGAGGCLMVWTDGRNFGGPIGYDVYAHHVLATGLVDPAWTVNGNAVCSANGDQGPSQLVPDGSGGAIAYWTDDRGGAVGPYEDLYVQHVSNAGVMTGPPNGMPIATGGDAYTAAVSDGAGGAILFWEDQRNSSTDSTDIYSQHVVTTPNLGIDPVWAPGGVAISTAPDHQYLPSAASDGAGGGIVAWEDSRNVATEGTDIYANRVTSTACLGWSAGSGGVAPTGAADLELAQVGPNPTSGGGRFEFALRSAAAVRLSVLDVQGREMAVLAAGEFAAGRHTANLTRGGDRNAIGPGLYFLRLRVAGHALVRRFVLTN